MAVSFTRITRGSEYSRNTLAGLWGYASYHAIARGVVTPKHDNKIILFVTEHKQDSLEQYEDRLDGDRLHWEGPNDHFGEVRMLNAAHSGDEIHLFYRTRHHTDFTYMGLVSVVAHTARTDGPSQFTLMADDRRPLKLGTAERTIADLLAMPGVEGVELEIPALRDPARAAEF